MISVCTFGIQKLGKDVVRVRVSRIQTSTFFVVLHMTPPFLASSCSWVSAKPGWPHHFYEKLDGCKQKDSFGPYAGW